MLLCSFWNVCRCRYLLFPVLLRCCMLSVLTKTRQVQFPSFYMTPAGWRPKTPPPGRCEGGPVEATARPVGGGKYGRLMAPLTRGVEWASVGGCCRYGTGWRRRDAAVEWSADCFSVYCCASSQLPSVAHLIAVVRVGVPLQWRWARACHALLRAFLCVFVARNMDAIRYT